MATKKRVSLADLSLEDAIRSGLVKKILITLALLAVYRFGVIIPLPGLDQQVFAENSNIFSSGIFGMVDMFAGGALSMLSVFALGIGPFITSSIMLQLLSEVFPSIKSLQREHGESGRKQYQQYIRLLSVIIGASQSFGLAKYLQNADNNIFKETLQATGVGQHLITSDFTGWLFIVQMVLILVTGSLFVMWLGEQISEFGIGNGGSLLIFAGIATRLPSLIRQTYESFTTGSIHPVGLYSLLVFFLFIIIAIICLQETTRRLLIVGAKSNSVITTGQNGQAGAHYLPLKLNPAGVLPIIFATMTMFVPFQILSMLGQKNMSISGSFQSLFEKTQFLNPVFKFIQSHSAFSAFFSWLGNFFDKMFLSYSSVEHSILYLFLVIMFAFFYSSILLPSKDIAENLQKGGSAIQGVKPGKPTGDYLELLIKKLTFIGAVVLGLIAISPSHVEKLCQVSTLAGLGSTSLIIMVGVAVDLYNQIMAYVQANQYKTRSLLN